MSKYYVMPMFPYPSGDSMHVGHASNYIINDFVARYKKMQGFDVIHPMGFDSFGLPTENYAIKTGKSARQATKDNIVNFKEQIKAINLQFDPEREFATSDPEYYKWTQWIFARLFEHGLAYKKDGLVNRCNGCQTVLANDQVVDGKCERCETIIIQKKHPQRYIKTTALANELIDDLDSIDRPEETKTIQKNWIGRSFGAEIDFTIEGNGGKLGKAEEKNLTITVFTTRPDTLYGVTALVLAPENQIIDHLLSSEKQKELEIFRNEVAKLTSIDRQSTEREKNGMNSGIFVTHPLTQEQVPVWFADYVLMDYATGAVMMVPAHDERDREFAKRYDIMIKQVIDGGDKESAHTESGLLINSAQFDGIDNITAKTKITEYLESLGCGRKKTTFRLRDRSVSRQRYRGSPIPVYYTFQDNQKVAYFEGDGDRLPQKDKPIITRRVTSAIIKHRSEDKFLFVKRKNSFGYAFATGGIDEGENIQEAGIREVKEETGYQNIQFIQELDAECHSSFYAIHKKVGRYMIQHTIVAKLKDEIQEAQKLESHEDFDLVWLSKEEVTEDMLLANNRYVWQTFINGKKPKADRYIDRYNAYNPHPDKSKWIPHLIPDEDLPVILPLDLPNYKPAGKSPLEDHPTFKYYTRQEQIGPVFEKQGNGIRLSITPERAPKESVGSKHTKTVSIIIQHPDQEKFLLVNHKSSDRRIFCGGGIDEGESILSAGVREMIEETGYYDIVEQKIIGENMMLDFYHPTKNINYLNNDNCIYIKLKSLEQKSVDQEELDKLEPIWIEKDEVDKSFVGGDGHKFRRNRFINSGKETSEADDDYIKRVNNCAYEKVTYLSECDTLDTFMCSSFYFLRYLDPANTSQLISHEAAKNMPVDLYIGGKEHAVGHLIYSRFIYKFLQKYGYIHTEAKEPFVKLIHQGMVHASDGRKFSKRRGNGINPLDVVKEHNTDTLRTYLAFMGPIELPKNWNSDGVAGVGRFLKRFEKLVEFVHDQSDINLISIIHQTIKAVGEDMDSLKFNTAISKLMIATNAIYEKGQVDNAGLQNLIILLAPFAPDTAQRMWTAIGQDGDVTKQTRPTYEIQYIQNSTIELPIQINGKTKGSLSVNKDITQDEAIALVRQDEKMSKYLEGGIKKIIRVPGRICNIII